MVRVLTPDDAAVFFRLRRAALEDAPMAFGASPGDDMASSIEAAGELLGRGPDSVVIGAFREYLVGTIGIARQRSPKRAHKMTVWGMYVAPQARQEGIGRALVDAGIAHAATLKGIAQIHLSVSETAAAARRLYERCGFTVWGTEPDALRHGGVSAAEHHMVYELPPAAS